MTTLAPSARGDANAWLQAGRIAFIALYAFTLLAAARWLLSNVREVGVGHRAVIVRLGAIAHEQSSGLLWAWPQPIDQVVLLPAAESVLELHVQALLRSQQALNADAMAYDDDEGGPVSDALAGSGYLLTGDAGIVQLDVRVFYKVNDPRSYVLQGAHVLPALDRIATHAAVVVCAARDLDTILVARPELLNNRAHGANEDAQLRERLRSELLAQVNRSLHDLERNNMGLGIEVTRIDVQSSLPRDTLNAFNGVLTASQQAEQAIADARTDAARIAQQATQAADRNLQVARANASERLAKAQADTASVLQLATAIRDRTEPGLLMRVYRERMPGILGKAGGITSVDMNDAQLIIPGASK